MTNDTKSIFFALLAVGLWSTVATAFKIALKSVDYLDLLFYSSLFTLFFYGIIVFSTNHRNVLTQVSKRDLTLSILMGFLNPFLYYLLLFKAYSLLKAQEALSLNYTWAIILTILISIIQKKKIGVLSYLALMISFLGVIIILSKGKIFALRPSDPFGAFLAISSALVWSTFWVLNSISKLTSIIRMFYNFLFGTFFILLFQLLFVGGIVISPILSYLPVIYISLFEMGVTFLLWGKALNLTRKPAIVNNLVYLSPLISIFFINTLLGEKIELPTLLGLLLIIIGLIFQHFVSKYPLKVFQT